MATANYVLLEKITVGAAGASSVTFNSIPQTGYTDLVVKFSTRDNDAGTFSHLGIIFNGDTGANYTSRYIRGDGNGSVVSNSSTTNYIIASYSNAAGSTANSFGIGEVYIPNYTSSNQKSVSLESMNETNAATAYMNVTAGIWTGTSAITSITFKQTLTGPFVQYSTFYLYGVAKLGTTPAIQPYATGGDTIMTDGTYWYHTFTSSGTFTPQKSLSCDYLVVAGGGGGGANRAGGGGAGGFRTSIGGSALSVGTSAYTVTVGAGGAGGAPVRNRGASGSNSVFSTITSNGGGGGGTPNTPAGVAGGSGGGGTDGGAGGAGNTPSTSPSQGNNGGTNPGGQTGNPAAGGGGAGAVGGNGSNSNAGAGGAGTASSISGSSVTYAGGGGGGIESGYTAGAGGAGGGGAGSSTGNGNAGTANTGGGGGGSASTDAYTGGNGGSGIVIVRYAV